MLLVWVLAMIKGVANACLLEALMAEHMKAMQDGMKLMEGMAKPGMAGMAGMAGMKGMGGMSAEMNAHHAMMEKRMTMMQTMMKMMMDCMPAAPAR